MKLSAPKLIFLWGILFAAVLIAAVKFDLHQHPFIQSTAKGSPVRHIATGRIIWDKYECNRCHRINGEGQKMGPDLSRVGVRHDRTWLTSKLANPQRHNAGSVVPSLSNITEDERQELIDYLSGLRGTAE
jgi:hypothetical protein